MLKKNKNNNEGDKSNEDLQKELEEVKKKLNAVQKENKKYKEEMVKRSIFERWKIGQYLHDDLAQTLVSVKIMISQFKKKLSAKKTEGTSELNEILNLIDKSIRGTRNLSHELIPIDVKKEGISQALRLLEVQIKRNYKVDVTLETGDIIHKINSRKVATNLYHIAQEAIKNAITHGDAHKIKIALIEHENKLYLHVKDNGKGFDYSSTLEGMGINIMKHRTEEMGGTFRIKKAKEKEFNTCVTCKLPMEALKQGVNDQDEEGQKNHEGDTEPTNH